METLLKSRAAKRPVIVMTGARQAGKTSLVTRAFPSYGYVSLDLPSEAEQAEHDPAAFLERHPSPLIVDEVQYAPSLFRHLKAAVDKRRGAIAVPYLPAPAAAPSRTVGASRMVSSWTLSSPWSFRIVPLVAARSTSALRNRFALSSSLTRAWDRPSSSS